MIRQYEKVRVENVSLTTMQDIGFDIEDKEDVEKDFVDSNVKIGILSFLTTRQRQVIICIERGLDRKETAKHLMISRQSINQIIPRIRKRLREKGVSYEKNYSRGAKPRISVFSPAS